MMFRNSYRLLLANFGTFWKNLLYKFIVVCLIALLTWPVFSSVSSLSNFNEFLTSLQNLFLTFPFTNLPLYLTKVYDFINLFFGLINSLFSLHTAVAIYLTFLYLIAFPFLLSLSDLAVSEVLYGSMSSQTKYGYTASFIKKIGRSSVYSIFKTLIALPFAFLTCYVLYEILTLTYNEMIPLIIVPILFLLSGILIYGFKITLFSGWAPSIIVFNCNVFKAMGKGIVAIFRRFLRSYSTVCMILLVSIMLLNLFGFLSLILILPLTVMTFVIFQMVMFFGSQGMRYYVDPDTILCPKKLEETDKFRKVKNII